MGEMVRGGAVEWEVFDPNAEYEMLPVGPAPRLPDLNNKKIGLYWNGKPDGRVLLDAIGELLQDRFEGIELLKFEPGFPLAAEAKRRVAEKSDAVIAATGD